MRNLGKGGPKGLLTKAWELHALSLARRVYQALKDSQDPSYRKGRATIIIDILNNLKGSPSNLRIEKMFGKTRKQLLHELHELQRTSVQKEAGVSASAEPATPKTSVPGEDSSSAKLAVMRAALERYKGMSAQELSVELSQRFWNMSPEDFIRIVEEEIETLEKQLGRDDEG